MDEVDTTVQFWKGTMVKAMASIQMMTGTCKKFPKLFFPFDLILPIPSELGGKKWSLSQDGKLRLWLNSFDNYWDPLTSSNAGTSEGEFALSAMEFIDEVIHNSGAWGS